MISLAGNGRAEKRRRAGEDGAAADQPARAAASPGGGAAAAAKAKAEEPDEAEKVLRDVVQQAKEAGQAPSAEVKGSSKSQSWRKASGH